MGSNVEGRREGKKDIQNFYKNCFRINKNFRQKYIVIAIIFINIRKFFYNKYLALIFIMIFSYITKFIKIYCVKFICKIFIIFFKKKSRNKNIISFNFREFYLYICFHENNSTNYKSDLNNNCN